MKFDSATHYSYKNLDQTTTSRVRLRPEKESDRVKAISAGREVVGTHVLLIRVPEDDARAIEMGNKEALERHVQKLQDSEVSIIRGVAFIAEDNSDTNHPRLALRPIDNGRIEEFTPSLLDDEAEALTRKLVSYYS